MKLAVVLVLAVVIVAAESAHSACGTGCAASGSNSKSFCENLCTSCNGHVNCNHHKDECECHEHKPTAGATAAAANMALVAMMAAKEGINPVKYREWAMKQIHYALGDTGFSYVIGFDKDYPHSPHHRSSLEFSAVPGNLFMYESSSLTPPYIYGEEPE